MKSVPRTVNEIMSRQVVSVKPHETVGEAVRLMVNNHLSAVPVADDGGKCLGMLSVTDVLHLIAGHSERADDCDVGDSVLAALHRWDGFERDVGSRIVSSVMSPDACVLDCLTTICEAARTMAARGVHRLPVVDSRGQIIGLVSTMDITRVMGKLEGALAGS